MKTINVEGLPDRVVRALEALVEAIRKELQKNRGERQGTGLPQQPLERNEH